MDYIFEPEIENRFAALLPKDSFVPANILRRMLSGQIDPVTGKDSDEYGYKPAEQKFLLGIAEQQAQKVRDLPIPEQALWLSAAGGPGAGKTVALLMYVAAKSTDDGSHYRDPKLLFMFANDIFNAAGMAFVSPDRDGLASIGKAVAISKNERPRFDKDLYLKWRWGSNFLSNLKLSQAFSLGKSIAHDTTLGSPFAVANLEKAKQAGRYVAVLVGAAPIGTRSEAVDKKNKRFFQSLPGNVIEQDRVFGENLPAIIKQADEVHISWRPGADDPMKEVALVKNNQTLSIWNVAKFKQFSSLYPQMAALVPGLTRGPSRSELPSLIRAQAKLAENKT